MLARSARSDISARIIDLIAPVGKGKRGLIVSPPKAGKTLVLQNIAQSITANDPDVRIGRITARNRMVAKYG